MSKLARSDYLRIKWPIIALVGSILITLGVSASLRSLDASAVMALNAARTQFDEAQTRVDLIEEEEAMIREYIGQYQDISAAGIVGNEDRLQFLEQVAELRAAHSLFPINIEIEEQRTLDLQYGELSSKPLNEPGRPISLRISWVDFSLPLLHENDLTNLLNGLLTGNELLQTQSCSISTSVSDGSSSYLRLGQHFNANCSLAWFTFAIDAPAATEAMP